MNIIRSSIFALSALPLVALAEPVDFVREIQPLLTERCVTCHGPEKQKGGLRLDCKNSAMKGGDSDERGIVPGKADDSRVFHAVISTDEDEQMPPRKDGGKALTAEQIDMLKRWINEGATWPDYAVFANAGGRSEMKVTDEDRQHWSFRPLANLDVSHGASVDEFIRAAQQSKGLTLSAPADPRTLVRRIFFDLAGLPPSPDEMFRWTARISEKRESVSALVDELLSRPQYGERWARHWLDVARYADSNGMEADWDRPNAYHFRDFVIRALNNDMPFDQFVRWQLAGDEFAPENPEAIAATGFIAAGPNEVLKVPMEEEKLRGRANELDDMVSTTGQAMLGLTLACARCHDHKYDPLPTRDYYRIMRVFNSGDRMEVPLASPSVVKEFRAKTDAWKAESDAATKARDAWMKESSAPFVKQVRAEKIASLKLNDEEKQLLIEKPDDAAARKLADRFKKELKTENADYVALFPQDKKAEWRTLDERVKAVAKRKPAELPVAFAFADFGPEPKESWFFERGNFLARNEKMELGFLTVLTNGRTPDEFWKTARESRKRDDTTQQRRALAEWMTDREHGAGVLVARVMVNRVWQHHFGEGLVRTSGDFGTRGERPTHPELLEWLTGEFVRSGWSVKHLHRIIMNSATYQQGSGFDKSKAAIDPENCLLWRRRPLRLESEILRDSMLAVAGSLNPEMFGPSFKPPIPAEAMQARNVKSAYPADAKDTPETRRRTVYMYHKRVVQHPLMQAFDAPDSQQSARRMNTTVAPQALALLNNPFVRARAAELAKRAQATLRSEEGAPISEAFQLALNREPSDKERADAYAFVRAQAAARAKREPALPHDEVQRLALTDFCQSLFALNEFIYID